jgi:hypothetical protein
MSSPQLPTPREGAAAPEPGSEAHRVSALKRHGAFTYDSLRHADHTQRAPLVEGLIYAGSRNILVGRSGLGKTPLLAQLGVGVASGRGFLGRAVRQGPVVIYDCESPAPEYVQMLERVSRHLGLPHPPNDLYIYSPNWDPRDHAPKGAAERAEQLGAMVRDVRPVLVIVDPLRGLWPYAEGKNENAVAMYDWMKPLTRETGAAWLILHHLRKANRDYPVDLATDPDSWLEEAAGAHALINHADTRLGIDRHEGDEDRLQVSGIMRHHGRLTPVVLERTYSEDGVACGYAIETPLAQLADNYRNAYESLPEAFNWAQATAALRASSKSTVSAFIKACSGLQLVRAEGGRGAQVYRKVAETGELRDKAA